MEADVVKRHLLGQNMIPHFVVFVIILMIMDIQGISALKCHQCTQWLNSHTKCNNITVQCTDPSHDACFTEVMRSAAFDKRYKKGCVNLDDCEAAQNLNGWKYCKQIPSYCTHCCTGDLCNAFNTSAKLSQGLPLQLLTFVFSLSQCLLRNVAPG